MRYFVLLGLLVIALANYSLARVVGNWAWVGIVIILCFLWPRMSGLIFDREQIRRSWRIILSCAVIILVGLLLFLFLGVQTYFSGVGHLWLFVIWIPIAEELLFRGWIFGILEKYAWYPVVTSSVLFSLHHIQYEHYHFSYFLAFQMAYTFVFGLLVGNIRKSSGSVYIGILLHILINFAVVFQVL